MWLAEDDFQFAWKKMSGDVNLTAEISFHHYHRQRAQKSRADDPAESGC